MNLQIRDRNGLFPREKQWQDADVDALQMMRVFSRVAVRASFAAAAEDLRMSRASVTKHVAAPAEDSPAKKVTDFYLAVHKDLNADKLD